MDGVINIYKERGFTSHDVVAKLRGILRQKKIGHTGTLDPDAVGVLPVCLGKGTKICEFLSDEDKTYRAVLRLGVTTDTQDHTGKILRERSVDVTEEQVREVIEEFEGKQMQLPPMYSALKVNGRKLYELAREGREVERKAREIYIYEIQILKIELPLVEMKVTCSKGTYIRTLCHDIGEKLGCGGCMQELTRTRVGTFYLEDSLTLAQVESLALEGTLERKVIPVEEMFQGFLRICCPKSLDKCVHNGNPVLAADLGISFQGQIRLCDSRGVFIGIYQWREDRKQYFPVKMFYP